MSPRPRTVLLGLALGFAAAALPAAAVGARPAQDPGVTFGGQGTVVSTTLPGGSSVTADPASLGITSTTTASSATLVDAPEPTSTRLVTESRKVMAVIGALLIVALALMLLTVRYVRITKPVPPEPVIDDDEPVLIPDPEPEAGAGEDAPAPDADAAAPAADSVAAEPEPEPAPVAASEAGTEATPSEEPAADPSADHSGADADWEPHSTGEHEQVVVAAGATARPSAAARRRALGLSEGP